MVLLGVVGLLCAAAAPPQRPVLATTFSANAWSHNYASGSFNQTTIGSVIVDSSRQSVAQESPLADGRDTRVVLDYSPAGGGVWSLQPFFDERVCYIYPTPGGGGQQETFAQALQDIFCPQGGTANLPCMGSYDKSTYGGEGTVDGKPCSLWTVHENKPPKTVEDIVFCVAKDGALLSVNLTFHGQQTLRYGNPPQDHTFNVSTISHNVFRNLSTTPDPAAFAVPSSGCVDLRPIKIHSGSSGSAVEDQDDDGSVLVNHPQRVARIDAQAQQYGWRAGPNKNFAGMTVAEASSSLGLAHFLGAGDLASTAAVLQFHHKQQQQQQHEGQWQHKQNSPSQTGLNRGRFSYGDAVPIAEASGGVEGLPVAFDARDKWGDSCLSIGTIRNQGACGSCVRSHADPTCIPCAICLSPTL